MCDDNQDKRLKKISRIVSLIVGFVVFMALNLFTPPEQRAATTFIFISGVAYGLTLLAFSLFRAAAKKGWAEKLRVHSRVYYISRTKLRLIWTGAISLSLLSLIGGVISRSSGLRFFLTYFVPIVLVGLVASISSGKDEGN